MATARYIEHRITRELLNRRERKAAGTNALLAERLITVAAVTAAMLLLGSYAPELVWALIAGAAALPMGTRSP